MATFRPSCVLGIRTLVIFKKSYASSFWSPEAAVTILGFNLASNDSGFWISFYIFILGFNLASNDSHKITQGLKQHLFYHFRALGTVNLQPIQPSLRYPKRPVNKQVNTAIPGHIPSKQQCPPAIVHSISSVPKTMTTTRNPTSSSSLKSRLIQTNQMALKQSSSFAS